MNAPIIEATDLTRQFTTGSIVETILKGISISVKEGEFVAIMGKSGAGKSTLLYQLSILDTPSSGTLTINNVKAHELSESAQTEFRLNNLGFVFQDYALVPDLTARENVVLPLLMRGLPWQESLTEADKALDSVGLQNKYFNTPAMLSGGEQQRVAVARAIVGKPKILFADEPTANLDSISGHALITLLQELHSNLNQTIVMVTHEREYALGCNRIFHMEDGRIVAVEQL